MYFRVFFQYTDLTSFFFFFFFNDTATTEIYTLSLHDALPISLVRVPDSWQSAMEMAPSIRDRHQKRNHQPMPGQQGASKTEPAPIEIKLAHSPDSDDAFMFYALATHKLSTPGYKYTHILSDIQSLNEAALEETYDVTAISFAAYPELRDKYVLLDCGASFGRSEEHTSEL